VPVSCDGGLAEQLKTAGTVINKEAAKNALLYGIIGSAIGTVAGAIIGASKGIDEIYQVEGNPMMQQIVWQKLRYDARFPDYR
jgi:ADP-ribosylglycohydrolase